MKVINNFKVLGIVSILILSLQKEFTLSLDNDTQNETVVGLHRKDM